MKIVHIPLIIALRLSLCFKLLKYQTVKVKFGTL